MVYQKSKRAMLAGAKAAWRARAASLVIGSCAVGATCLTVGAAGFVLSGCSVSDSDVKKWEMTEHGPYKLVAVVTHDKYSGALRVEAALSLVRMAPRGGIRKGLAYLLGEYKDDDGVSREGALIGLPEEDRRKIVDGMAPELIRQMGAPPPVNNPEGTVPDPSVPYKDAAFALLSHDPPLVGNEKTKADLMAALTYWVQADFENRIENKSQQYGLEQMMRMLGAPSVKALPGLINENSYRLDRTAGLIADLGDPDTKLRGSQALVALAKKIESPEWSKKESEYIDGRNKEAKQKATKEQLAQQVKTMLDKKLNEDVFPAMKRIGGRPVVDYLLAYAADEKNDPDRRKVALAALEGRVDKSNTADVDRLFNIAKDDNTPDGVRDLAFARLGELPKDQILKRLYTIFEPKKWKVRWVAASTVLKTITTKDLGEFMSHLPQNASTKMGMTEPLSYGGIIAKMEPPPGGPKPRDALAPYLQSRELGPKLVALGQFWGGKKSDVSIVAPYESDSEALPRCDAADDCGWNCDVPKPGSTTGEKESKPIGTVGDFVKLCLVPSMDQ